MTTVGRVEEHQNSSEQIACDGEVESLLWVEIVLLPPLLKAEQIKAEPKTLLCSTLRSPTTAGFGAS